MTALLSPHSLADALQAELRDIDRLALRRTLRPVRRLADAMLDVDGRTVVDFASNDYLGLAHDPRVAAAAAESLHDGVGAGAARLITGDHPAHERIEARLARLKRTERALLFASGYMANAGALAALAGPQDAIYSDALNHASIIDGCRLSRATVRIVPHNDVVALDEALGTDAGRFRRRWIVVEGVYSMDGDLAPLNAIVDVARRHRAFTFVDDAHATGVVGPDGSGSAAHHALDPEAIDVTVGTLGKALGTAGAFVAGSTALCDLLLHRARSFVFTTASPPSIAAATLRAIEIAHDEPWRREQVRANARRLRTGLATLGYEPFGTDDGHIVPIVIGDAAQAAALGTALFDAGFAVGAIRPPTVAPGAARLRLTVSAAHGDAQIDALLAAMAGALATHAPAEVLA